MSQGIKSYRARRDRRKPQTSGPGSVVLAIWVPSNIDWDGHKEIYAYAVHTTDMDRASDPASIVVPAGTLLDTAGVSVVKTLSRENCPIESISSMGDGSFVITLADDPMDDVTVFWNGFLPQHTLAGRFTCSGAWATLQG